MANYILLARGGVTLLKYAKYEQTVDLKPHPLPYYGHWPKKHPFTLFYQLDLNTHYLSLAFCLVYINLVI